MTCLNKGACAPEAGFEDGCYSWRKSIIVTIPQGSLSATWSYKAQKTTKVMAMRIASIGATPTAPNSQSVSFNDEEGDVLVKTASLATFQGNTTARPGSVVTKGRAPVFYTTIHEGQTVNGEIFTSAAEAVNALTFEVFLYGRTDAGCGDATCLAEADGCKCYTEGKVFAGGAGSLPSDADFGPGTPMRVFDLFADASIALDSATATEVAIKQQGDALAEGADVRTYDQSDANVGPFLMAEATTSKPVQVSWGGTAQVAANRFQLTLTGKRLKPSSADCGC